MAVLHKLVRGGEQWLAFAMTRLRTLAALGLPHVSQSFEMGDGSLVSVRISDDQHHLRIDGGAASYEFFTSEAIDAETLGTPGVDPVTSETGVVYYPVLGSGTLLKGRKLGKSLWSSVFTPADPPKWGFIPPNMVGGNQAAYESFFKTFASWQNQKNQEYVWRPDDLTDLMVTSTMGTAPGRANMAGWLAFSCNATAADSCVADVGKDVPVAVYSKEGLHAQVPSFPTHQYWRRAATQTVASAEFGSRTYIIMSDAHGRFAIWQKRAQTTPRGTQLVIPESGYQLHIPAYPGWVTLPSSASNNNTGQWFWQFNKEGTKVVSVPFKRTAGSIWTCNPQWDAEGVTTNPTYAEVQYDRLSMRVQTLIYGFETEGFTRGQEDIPGLCEFGINITTTGPGVNDFTASFPLLQSSYWDDDKRYYVDAAYLMTNRRLGNASEAVLGAPEGTLLTAEVEVYFKSTDTNPEPAKPPVGIASQDSYYDYGGTGTLVRRYGVVYLKRTITTPGGWGYDLGTIHYIAAGFSGAVDMGTLSISEDGFTIMWTRPPPEPTNVFEGALRYPPRIARYPLAEDAFVYQHQNEPGFKSALMGRFFAGNLLAYYVVRNHATQEIIRRIPLSSRYAWCANGTWQLTDVTYDQIMVSAFGGDFSRMGVRLMSEQNNRDLVFINYADLRSLSFVTHSNIARGTTAANGTRDYTFRGNASSSIVWNEDVATTYSGFVGNGGGAMSYKTAAEVPATLLTAEPPEGYVKLPYATPNDDDAALMCIQNAALRHLSAYIQISVPVHPDGNWSIGSTFLNDEHGVHDVIQGYAGSRALKRKNHKDEFNRAFNQTRSKDFYGTFEYDGNLGSFCTWGVWFNF